MVAHVHQKYNQRFTEERYQALLAQIENDCPGQLEFRISETPAFMDKALKEKLIEAGEYVVSFLKRADLKELTAAAIPAGCNVPGEPAHSHYLTLDYAICQNAITGDLEPRMIELQGFASLFAFQEYFSGLLPNYLYVPEGYSYFFDKTMNGQTFISLLKSTICGTYKPEECVLLDIEPDKQKTRVDFFCTQKLTGVEAVCLTKLEVEGNKVYRRTASGRRVQVKRIYNRVIFDELQQRSDLTYSFDFSAKYELEWTGHPGWFFRISKYLLPYLDHPSVPKTHRLTEFAPAQDQLANYVLKPLYSFAGQGVVFDVTQADIDAVADPKNWILMEKVHYAPAIKAPEFDVKCEIRMMYLWPDGAERPTLTTNLIRLSQGTMMGVRFNKDKTWVGGNTAYLEM